MRKLEDLGARQISDRQSLLDDDPQQGRALMRRTVKYVGLDVHQAATVASDVDGTEYS